jgi:hypothetical protein
MPPWANNSPPHYLQNCLQFGRRGQSVEAIGDPLHPALAVDERGEGMVDRELLRNGGCWLVQKLDIGSLGTPVEAEFDG